MPKYLEVFQILLTCSDELFDLEIMIYKEKPDRLTENEKLAIEAILALAED